MVGSDIIAILERYTFRVQCEKTLQRFLSDVLTRHAIAHTREVQLSRSDIIDFLCENIGIECKIKGGLNALLRQLSRYLQHPSIHSIILVTTVSAHMAAPDELHGKKIHKLLLRGGIL